MKEILNKLTDSISNIEEKTMNQYDDVDIYKFYKNPNNNPLTWNIVAKLAEDFFNENKNKYDEEERLYYEVDQNITKLLGFNSIHIYFYKGFGEGFNSSNFIYNRKTNNFDVDIYGCEFAIDNEIYELFLQELYNFKRDAEWLIEGKDKYERKILEMKLRTLLYKKFSDRFK